MFLVVSVEIVILSGLLQVKAHTHHIHQIHKTIHKIYVRSTDQCR